MGRILAIAGAVFVHVAILLFGGIFFLGHGEGHETVMEVEVIDPTAPVEEKKPDPVPEAEPPPVEEEQPPKPEDIGRAIEQVSDEDPQPALERASISAIEAMLGGQPGAGGDFADALTFKSGVIGGTGTGEGGDGESAEDPFDPSDIDQKPRPIFQGAPSYPAALRGKKTEGLVTIIFVVDPAGKVTGPRIERSSHPAFEKPALDAVKRWRFEPAMRGGQRVACKMRAPIRFQPSS